MRLVREDAMGVLEDIEMRLIVNVTKQIFFRVGTGVVFSAFHKFSEKTANKAAREEMERRLAQIESGEDADWHISQLFD